MKAYTKLHFSSSTKPCSFTKTCSFRTYLEPGSIFGASVLVSRRLVLSRRHLHSERRTYIEPGSFSFCFGFNSTMTTSHFDFKCFVINCSCGLATFGIRPAYSSSSFMTAKSSFLILKIRSRSAFSVPTRQITLHLDVMV